MLRPNGAHHGSDRYEPPASNICSQLVTTIHETWKTRRPHAHDLQHIHLLPFDNHLVLISIPILKEHTVQPKQPRRLLGRQQEPRHLPPINTIAITITTPHYS